MSTITIFGGTGFIGSRLASRLASHGHMVRVVARRPPQRDDGTVEHVRGSILDPQTIARAVGGSSAVVNLVGTTTADGADAFYRLHRDAARSLAGAAAAGGAARFVHVSAMGAAADAPSLADRSKAAGELAVADAFPSASIVRPALVFGPGDHFFTWLARLARRALVVPLIGGGRTRFAPIHVDDFIEAVVGLLEGRVPGGRVFEPGAGEIWTLRELIETACASVSPPRSRLPILAPVPFRLAEAGARLAGFLPAPPLTVDQVRLLQTDKVPSPGAHGPAALGLHAAEMKGVAAELRRRCAQPGA